MTQIHIVIRRINPAFKIDLIQVGCIEDGQFSAISLDALECTPIPDFVEYSSISDSPYIDHCRIPILMEALVAYPDFSVEFFDNTLVIMFNANLTHDEVASKEEGKGN